MSYRERQILYDITYMPNQKKKGTNELIYETKTYSENKLQLSGGRGWGDRLGDWDWHKYMALFEIDNQQGPSV